MGPAATVKRDKKRGSVSKRRHSTSTPSSDDETPSSRGGKNLERSGMTIFAPLHVNPPVSRFFILRCRDSRADFLRTFRKTGGINRETGLFT